MRVAHNFRTPQTFSFYLRLISSNFQSHSRVIAVSERCLPITTSDCLSLPLRSNERINEGKIGLLCFALPSRLVEPRSKKSKPRQTSFNHFFLPCFSMQVFSTGKRVHAAILRYGAQNLSPALSFKTPAARTCVYAYVRCIRESKTKVTRF